MGAALCRSVRLTAVWTLVGVVWLGRRRSTVVIKNVFENTQAFLQGHTDRVSCLAVSSDGKRLASGQDIEMGFKVRVRPL